MVIVTVSTEDGKIYKFDFGDLSRLEISDFYELLPKVIDEVKKINGCYVMHSSDEEDFF